MEDAVAPENSPASNAEAEQNPKEEKFIRQYACLTVASVLQARSVYMFYDIIRHRNPCCYRLE